MNINTTASQFMDKQIMDLSSNSQSTGNSDFIDFMNRSPEKKNETVASYDFMPIRPTGQATSSPPPPVTRSAAIFDSADENATLRSWSSSDLKTNASPNRNYSSHEADEPETLTLRENQKPVNASLDGSGSFISDIDRTMKKYTDMLMHAMDGVIGRLSQLETRTGRLENMVDDLKVSVGNSHGSTDGKMRHIENILREVHTGVAAIRDKQEIMDAQLKIGKLNVSKAEPVESQNTGSLTQPPPSLPPPNTPVQHNFPPAQLPNQVPPTPHQDSYFPPPVPTPENPNQQYQAPPPQQQLPQYQSPPQPHNSPPTPPQHHYQSPHQSQYSQPLPPKQPPPPFSTVNHPPPHHPEMPPQQPPPPFSTVNPSPPHRLEETPYPPPQTYPPAIHAPHPSQQYYGPPPGSYEALSNRPSSGYSSPFSPSSGHVEPYPYTNSQTKYVSGSPMKGKQQHYSPFTSQGGGSSYPQLPTARILPQALPTASGIGGGSGSGSGSGSGNKVSVDDVVDKVTNMGFSRDQVRAAVRKLTENGQSIDLNVVLDKVMNDGDGQAPRGWFGR